MSDAPDDRAPLDAPAERARRLADIEELRAAGVDPYPVRFDRDRTLGELRAEFGALEPGVITDTTVRVAGRILLIRRQGKLSFATVRDQSGSVQLFVSSDEVGEQGHRRFDRLDRGGATARPFVTHHNALDLDLYLRIATELHLKRLVVGGFERVFEIGRTFRNEGIDTTHNPEFTTLEAYQAFGDYTEMMELTESLVVDAARAALDGRTTVEIRGQTVDLAEPWPRAAMVDLIREHAGVEIHPSMDVERAHAVLDGLGIEYEARWGAGRLTHEVYDRLVEPNIVRPTFVLDHPRETSPLARAHRDDPSLVERFEVVADGSELANAYSELNDPVDQRERFEAEARARAAGDLEAGTIDEDYLRALEYGMPPTGGLGIGIDRLVMLLAEVTSIREVILFPTLRPEA